MDKNIKIYIFELHLFHKKKTFYKENWEAKHKTWLMQRQLLYLYPDINEGFSYLTSAELVHVQINSTSSTSRNMSVRLSVRLTAGRRWGLYQASLLLWLDLSLCEKIHPKPQPNSATAKTVGPEEVFSWRHYFQNKLMSNNCLKSLSTHFIQH